MIGTTPARATATTTTRSTAASTNATGPTNPPVLVFDGTVERLPSPISNAGCGSSLLCAGEPESCNPSMAGSCFFVGTKRTAGQNFEFSLSGESEGYIGCTLSTDSSLGGGDITFICANNKGNLKFIGASLDNGALSRQSVNANSVKGHINGTTIQCTFKATVPDATARGSATSFALAVVSGTFSPGTGVLGNPVARVQTQVLDLSNASSSTSILTTVATTTVTTTTVATSTVANSGRPTHLALSQALLIILGTMGLALL
ncbi:putative ferric-chelate reductase 1 isoform X5 [Gadus macrocephalus]|uniref:putative ferric-chelate reductase 1 isoform X5 n=1 Tax=Gadus macrocephalus TaxID=80720 RepID=UPI0028CB26D5|nr:putative ferric-chelate reductase 1 isoform X5 [Gadus macrocephalus]